MAEGKSFGLSSLSLQDLDHIRHLFDNKCHILASDRLVSFISSPLHQECHESIPFLVKKAELLGDVFHCCVLFLHREEMITKKIITYNMKYTTYIVHKARETTPGCTSPVVGPQGPLTGSPQAAKVSRWYC